MTRGKIFSMESQISRQKFSNSKDDYNGKLAEI
jgi:hypothetical protein